MSRISDSTAGFVILFSFVILSSTFTADSEVFHVLREVLKVLFLRRRASTGPSSAFVCVSWAGGLGNATGEKLILLSSL